MINVLTNAGLASPQNTSILVWIACGGIWALICVVMLRDVYDSHRPVWGKLLWSLLLIGLPVVSGILYASVSMITSDWSDISALRRQSRRS